MDGFETERLIASRPGAGDLALIRELHTDERAMATLGGIRTEDDSVRFLRETIAHWERHGFGIWLLHDRATGRSAGRAGLRHVHVGGRDEIELAYALMPDFWNRGLATEIARALVARAFETRGLTDLVCFTLTTNTRSLRVMEKAGFQYDREIIHADLPHRLYRLK